jgi:urea carboxylase
VHVVAPAGSVLVESPLGGIVWKSLVRAGDRVQRGAALVSVESMKMQCEVPSPLDGLVRAVYVESSQAISAGAPIIAIEPDQSPAPLAGQA